MELIEHAGHELAALLASGDITSRELTEATFARIDAVEPSVKAYVTLNRDGALAQADAVDVRRKQGESLGPVAGIPIALKDNL